MCDLETGCMWSCYGKDNGGDGRITASWDFNLLLGESRAAQEVLVPMATMDLSQVI